MFAVAVTIAVLCALIAALLAVPVMLVIDAECVEALKRIGYGGAVVVEHEPEAFDPSDDLRAMRAELELRL